MPANVQIRNKDGTCYFLVCRDHIKYLRVMTVACVAGAWKKWVQERTGAREGDRRVCPFQSVGNKERNIKITRCLLIQLFILTDKKVLKLQS